MNWKMNWKSLPASVFFCSLLVLLASCSYAVLSTIVRLAVGAGYGIPVVLVGKFFYGFLILLLMSAVVFAVTGRRWKSVPWNAKRTVSLIGTGIIMALVTVCYFHSLMYLPISLAVVLLFQYSWMGVVIESAVSRRLPSKNKVLACLVILAGTLLAGGLFGSTLSLADMNPIGILLGLAAAFCYALFVCFSGRVSTDMRPLSRSLSVAAFGAVFVLLFVGLFYGGEAVIAGITGTDALIYSIPLGLFGIAVPILFLAVGAPKISVGMATILNSAELPLEVLLAAAIITEPVAPLRWLGVILILFGIALPYIRERRIVSGLEE